jgi:hypothetical protein
MFILNDGTHFLPCAFPTVAANPASVRPFEYMFHSVVQQLQQRGGVTITNNVIRPPNNGQSAFLQYTVTTPGPVTILVFDLSGNIANVLQRGSQSPGQCTTAWDAEPRRALSSSRDLLHQSRRPRL